ncbi:flavin reductase family protein [Rhizobium sp. FY34]|uniref:flavin reductase family protein n=1 Tax=Rhizobium sp. FY34 TaxID=2562309 RepID=UPI0010C13546|nr:flavin reductase family protein [Rhizobium sp. FY34]
MFYDPRHQNPREVGFAHDPWNALIAPRPIAWISTRSTSGVANLAPYSFFNAVSGAPPFVMFSSAGRKDSQRNIEETGEFVVNMATEALVQQLNDSCFPFSADVDEFERTGLTSVEARNLGHAPRLAESPVSIECRLSQIVELKTASGAPVRSMVIFGEVLGIHIDENIIHDGRVDLAIARPLSRLGYMDYAGLGPIFEILRPTDEPPERGTVNV